MFQYFGLCCYCVLISGQSCFLISLSSSFWLLSVILSLERFLIRIFQKLNLQVLLSRFQFNNIVRETWNVVRLRWLSFDLLRHVFWWKFSVVAKMVTISIMRSTRQQPTRRNTPEDDHFHTCHRENLKYHFIYKQIVYSP